VVIGVREEWIERDRKAFVTYLNKANLCGELNHELNWCLVLF
jgi:hypothetical protein